MTSNPVSDDYYCDFILNGRVPVDVVAETPRVLAFHHVFRTWDTHIVVIPKEHIRSLADVKDPGLLAEIFVVVIGIIIQTWGVPKLFGKQKDEPAAKEKS